MPLNIQTSSALLDQAPTATRVRLVPNGIPKAGTNLLEGTLKAIPELSMRPEIIPNSDWNQSDNYYEETPGASMVPVDIDCPHFVPQSSLETLFSSLGRGESLRACHLRHSSPLQELFERHQLKMILIVRDPRDVVVSQVHYTMRSPDNPLYSYYTERLESLGARVTASITGTPQIHLGGSTQHVSVAQRFDSIKRWLGLPFVTVVRFEDLVGERGGGTLDAQLATLRQILDHLDIDASPEAVASLGKQVFSESSRTFRKGTTGQWKDTFSLTNRRVFKEIAGQTLIDFGYESNFDW